MLHGDNFIDESNENNAKNIAAKSRNEKASVCNQIQYIVNRSFYFALFIIELFIRIVKIIPQENIYNKINLHIHKSVTVAM